MMMTEQVAEELAGLMTQLEQIQARIGALRDEIARWMIQKNVSELRAAGLHFFWRKNVPSRRFHYARCEKDHPELYSWLVEQGILKVIPPKTEKSLVVKREGSR